MSLQDLGGDWLVDAAGCLTCNDTPVQAQTLNIRECKACWHVQVNAEAPTITDASTGVSVKPVASSQVVSDGSNGSQAASPSSSIGGAANTVTASATPAGQSLYDVHAPSWEQPEKFPQACSCCPNTHAHDDLHFNMPQAAMMHNLQAAGLAAYVVLLCEYTAHMQRACQQSMPESTLAAEQPSHNSIGKADMKSVHTWQQPSSRWAKGGKCAMQGSSRR